jgi:hypothetical protein
LRSVRDTLEAKQIALYFTAVTAGALVAVTLPGVVALEAVINPALALMLFATFLQVPLADTSSGSGQPSLSCSFARDEFRCDPARCRDFSFRLLPTIP